MDVLVSLCLVFGSVLVVGVCVWIIGCVGCYCCCVLVDGFDFVVLFLWMILLNFFRVLSLCWM